MCTLNPRWPSKVFRSNRLAGSQSLIRKSSLKVEHPSAPRLVETSLHLAITALGVHWTIYRYMDITITEDMVIKEIFIGPGATLGYVVKPGV